MKLFDRCMLAAFAVYLVLGNIPRIGSFSRFGGFPASELALFVLAAFGCIRCRVVVPKPLLVISVLFLASWSIGALIHTDASVQDHLYALMYAVRVGAVVLASNYIGWILSRRYSLQSVKRMYIGIALAQVAIGIAIYVIFPQAQMLWMFLSEYGVNIGGDPHVRRLVGPIFDPNFFGNLLVLPTTLLIADILTTRARSAFPILLIMLIAILMTYSRSSFLGLAVCLFTLYCIILLNRSGVRYSTWSRGVYLFSLGVMLSIALVFLYPEVPTRLAERFAHMSMDNSAMARWDSLQRGLDYFLSFPYLLTGLGYNYLPFVTKFGSMTTGYDQSLLTLFATCGIPLGTLSIIMFWAWLRAALVWPRCSDVGLYASLIAYLTASLIMSMFNNLLFLPLYMFTVLPLLAYGYWKGKKDDFSRSGISCSKAA